MKKYLTENKIKLLVLFLLCFSYSPNFVYAITSVGGRTNINVSPSWADNGSTIIYKDDPLTLSWNYNVGWWEYYNNGWTGWLAPPLAGFTGIISAPSGSAFNWGVGWHMVAVAGRDASGLQYPDNEIVSTPWVWVSDKRPPITIGTITAKPTWAWTQQSVTLTWSPSTGADRYYIWINGGSRYMGNTTSTVFTPSSWGLSSGVGYRVFINACNIDSGNTEQCGGWVEGDTLNITSQPIPVTNSSVIVSPKNASLDQNFTISWGNGTNTTYYWLGTYINNVWTALNQGNNLSWTGTPRSVGFTEGSSYDFWVRACTNDPGWGYLCGDWAKSDGTFKVVSANPVINTFTVDKTSLPADGGSVIITWNTSNTTSCTASSNPATGDWTGSVDVTSGDHVKTVNNVTAKTTFNLDCVGPVTAP